LLPTHIRAHRSAAGAQGACHHAIGTSRGGRTTKIHALSDDPGRSAALALTPGVHHLAGAKALLAIRCPDRKLPAERAYDATCLRDRLAERGTEPVIPPNPTRKNPHACDRSACRGRTLIESQFCRLKDCRRIATRYDKRAAIFLAADYLAAAITWSANRASTLKRLDGKRISDLVSQE
jgi:transposase